MRVLIGCEESGIVCNEFLKLGHDAWSCDLQPSRRSVSHIQGDLLDVLGDSWDLLIAHPPCTHLAVSGARWFKDKVSQQKAALDFVLQIAQAPIDKICIENPISILSTKWRKPDQIIQPWWFGEAYTKSTCLWLKNLPLLYPTNISLRPRDSVHNFSSSINRSRDRAVTFLGIAKAMAAQWGGKDTNANN